MWVTIAADQVLYVDRGRDVVACDRGMGRELIIKLSPTAVAQLRAALK